MYCELNPFPLQEQTMLLTYEPSLQAEIDFFFTKALLSFFKVLAFLSEVLLKPPPHTSIISRPISQRKALRTNKQKHRIMFKNITGFKINVLL